MNQPYRLLHSSARSGRGFSAPGHGWCLGRTIRAGRSAGLLGYLAALVVLTAGAVPPELITVLPAARQQTLQGFGASINGWTRPLEPYFSDPASADFIANEIGMSVFRLQLWAGTLPEEVADWREIDHRKFDWAENGGARRGRINVAWARLMVAANPEVKIIGAVWSPPGWMKVSGRRQGSQAGYLLDPVRDYDRDNRLRPDRYEHFAKWVVEFARHMEAQGTPFHALSLQNELMFTEPYESCLYTPAEYAELVRVTGEMFEREGVRRPLFFGPEDMTKATYADGVRHRPYVDALLQSPAARFFDAFATHGYSDGVNADSQQNPVEYWRTIQPFGRPYWITEGGSGGHTWPEPIVSGIAARLHVALTQANVSLFTAWQINGRAGDASPHNIMAGGIPTAKTYATMHFWRHLRPGATRVEVAPLADPALLVSAYVDDARGQAITILINASAEAREVVLDWGRAEPDGWQGWITSATRKHEEFVVDTDQHRARLQLPGHSIITTVADWDRTRVEPAVNPRWEQEIAAIERREAAEPPPAEGILFVGSSSIRLWESLAADFPGQPVYNRGFGGSQLADLIGYFDRIIAAGRPRRIIVYSGTNDLHSGKSPEQVLDDLRRLGELVTAKLPGTTLAIIGSAPNPRRWSHRAEHQRFNAMAAVTCRQQGHDFINVWDPMLGDDGQPSRPIYRDDQLHMNAAGYVMWREIVGPFVNPPPAP